MRDNDPSDNKPTDASRRALLRGAGMGAAGLAFAGLGLGAASGRANAAVANQTGTAMPAYVGPEPNPYWNSIGPYVSFPQKLPLLRLTDRPVQLETPRHYFASAFTPNEAMFVRYHLPGEPNRVDLAKWRLKVEGKVDSPLSLTFANLLNDYEPHDVAAVLQCSGNSRSYFTPRVAGGQWGNGAIANAKWTGVRLRDVLEKAGVTKGAVQIQFQGLDFGKGPAGYGSHAFMKSWDIDDPALDEAIIAYAMNDAPMPVLNGFPTRMVFPGKFATYWVKHVSWIRLLDHEDTNFWMAKAYKIPDTPDGATTPEAVKNGDVNMVPIGNVEMPVRSFMATPDGATKAVAGMPLTARGVAFSGTGPVTKVEFSTDGGQNWSEATLGTDHGPYSFREWHANFTPDKPGQYMLAVRATDAKGHVQPKDGLWNPGGYLWNKIEQQQLTVGPAA